ncbi:MAG: glycosyltransferase family 2 protein [Gemmataceae bacterium]|nr:glycosyltransferase family 2 protein [Gemmataceae bacterium]
MKLLIQVPCLNEATTLPATLADLPRSLPGFDAVEFLVIDDGSIDGTADVARAHGAHHVIRLPGRQGLARAFLAGLLACLERGADVVVNTDADNQYDARCLPALLAPILEGRADVCVGARPIAAIPHYSWLKKLLQRWGSRFVRAVSGVAVDDAPCGFRAFTREAALRVQVFTSFSYTLETLIQAGASGLRVASVPIAVNPPTRPSRLFRGTFTYIVRSVGTILAAYAIYRPVRLFGLLGLACLLPGLFLAVRYAWLMAEGEGKGHVQSVIAAGVLGLAALLFFALALVGHLLRIQRLMLEELCYRARAARFKPP